MADLAEKPTITWPALQTWLRLDAFDEDLVTVVLVGGAAADRADELWSTVEYALELAVGRQVRVDLTAVTGFDCHTIDVLAQMIRTGRRRHDDLKIVTLADSPLEQYTRTCGLDAGPPHRPSITTVPAERPNTLRHPRRSPEGHTNTHTHRANGPQARTRA
jgi:anti-anti-sigma regulatory factor